MNTKDPVTPRFEKAGMSLTLTLREIEKLVIYQEAELAGRRRRRGLKLKVPESVTMITEARLDGAQDGRSVAEIIKLRKRIFTPKNVMKGRHRW